jgi:Tol biopolymer transport system component/DNA-binding winged helix-turn-helix (wHTH) protein
VLETRGARLQTVTGAQTMPANTDGNLRFGMFELDRRAGELRRNGSKVRLQEQPFQILLTLLERPGEVVTREELRSRLWPDDTFVDFEHSINTAVRRLRDALGDSAENPRFVETVARRGYRFLAPVNGVEAAVTSPPLAAAAFDSTRRWWIAGPVGVALFLGIVLGWHAAHRHASSSISNPSERRLTANAAELPVTAGVISSDGKYLAFTDASGLFLRQVDTGETHPVALPVGFLAKPTSWFPDGTHLLVTSVGGPQEPESIWEVSVVGGAPRKLVSQGAWPTLCPDGSKMAYLASPTQFKEAALNKEIWVARSDGGEPRKLLGGGEDLFGAPAWSPDGIHLAYMRGRFASGMPWIRSQLEVLDLSTGQSRVVVSAAGLGNDVAWAPDGRLIYSLAESVPNQNDSNLWAVRVDRNGHSSEPTRLTHGTGGASLISITTDGKRIAYFRQAVEPDVYIIDLESGGRKATPPRRLTFDERADVPYSWTPDSKSVIFISDRNGAFSIFRQGMQDTEPDTLVRAREHEDLAVPRLTPNGRSIVYLIPPASGAPAENPSRMMRASLSGGPSQEILEAPGISNQQCARLPSTVCIFSRFEPGHERFFYFDPEKGLGAEIPKAEINSINAYDFNWSLSPDGRLLAMARREGMKQTPTIRLLPLSDGPEKLIPVPGWAGIGTLDWAADGKSLWATGFNSDWSKTLLNVSRNGALHRMLDEKSMMLGWAIPSPNGKHLAIWKAHGDSNVWMLENF